MMRKYALVLGSALLAINAAGAYAAGDNVVVLAVNRVDVPARLPGLCEVKGSVSQVWGGKAFHAGETLSLKVPCGGNTASLIPAVATLDVPAGPRLIAADILRKSKQGFARVDDSGALIWDFTKESYGPWGAAGGYRVMDGAAVPAIP